MRVLHRPIELARYRRHRQYPQVAHLDIVANAGPVTRLRKSRGLCEEYEFATNRFCNNTVTRGFWMWINIYPPVAVQCNDVGLRVAYLEMQIERTTNI